MSVNRNIVANYLGSAWAAIIQLAFVPLYIGYLGMEAYGLIGFYASLQALLSLLDMGLTPTLTRELARFKAGALQLGDVRALLKTVETLFIGVALVIFVLVVAGSGWLAARWLKTETLPVATATGAICLMGGLIALRWLEGMYRGVIIGLQQLVWLNTVNAAFATLRGVGVLVVLARISPTIEAFFLYQAAVSLIELLVFYRKSWSLLAHRDRPAFSTAALRRIWRFSAGLTMISLLVLLLLQADKILLSSMLPLGQFGYYALASSVAGSLAMLIVPISGVAYPRLSELVERGDVSLLADTYHRFAQLLTVVLAPGALVLALFSERILMLWIADPATVRATAPLLGPLAVGAMLNGFMNIPNSLLLAYGNTRFMIALYTVFVLVFVPLVYGGVSAYGAAAAAYAWIAMNAACVAIAVPLMHRKLLPQEQWRWYWHDLALPLAAAFAAAYAVSLAAPAPVAHHNVENLLVVALALVLALFAAVGASPFARGMAARAWRLFSRSPA